MSSNQQREDEEEVYASDAEGERYRGTAYIPFAYDNLRDAPEDDDHPDTGTGGSYKLLDLPRVPKVSHVVGPSAIMLGASLGSGETLFWPLLIAENGWAVYWAFWVGVLTQFVINTEIQRWTLATGESIFRAFERVGTVWPLFFAFGGFVSLGWPGWAASAAEVGASGLGLGPVSVAGVTVAGWKALGIALMAVIWTTYQLTPVMYNVVERFQILLLVLTTVCTLALVVVAGSLGQLANLPAGALSVGTIPVDANLTVFLGGLAYAGAGGYLNLSQSLWIREKGYGMGSYQGRVKNPLIGTEAEPVQRDGFVFSPTPKNVKRWRGWWRVARLEHLLTFVLGLLVVATVMMSVSAEYATGQFDSAVTMWLVGIAPQLGGVGHALVYLVLFLALFTTEYAIVESFVRNTAEVVYELYGRWTGWTLPEIFWTLLTVFTGWGILIIALPIEQPFILLVTAAAMSGVMMWPYTALTLVINTDRLPEHTQPSWLRVVAMWWATGFFGFFSVLVIGNTLASDLGLTVFQTQLRAWESAPGGLALWGLFAVVQAYTMARSYAAKRDAAGTVAAVEQTERSR